MSELQPSDIIHIPGRLIADPFDLSPASAPNFGGTPLGNVAEIVIRVTHFQEALRGEEFASEIIDVVEGADDIAVGAFLRGFDRDAITRIFSDATVSTLTGKPQIELPGVSKRGSFGSDNSFVLLFAPENFEEHPALLMYNAIPLVEETIQLSFSFDLSKEFGIPVLFQGIRDSSNRIAHLKLLEDLAL